MNEIFLDMGGDGMNSYGMKSDNPDFKGEEFVPKNSHYIFRANTSTAREFYQEKQTSFGKAKNQIGF